MSKRSTAGLIKYVKFLMDAGAMKRPVWLEAVERMPPPPLPKHGKRPATIIFPEDELMKKYYARHPEAMLEPVDLTSFEPPTAKKFALRQVELIDQGMSRRESYAKVEAEFAAATRLDWQKGKGRSTVIEQIQREEEAHLKQALTTYVTNHGHKPMSQMKDPRRAPADGRPLPARRPVIATSSMGAPAASGAENAAAGAAGAPSPETPTGSSQ